MLVKGNMLLLDGDFWEIKGIGEQVGVDQ